MVSLKGIYTILALTFFFQSEKTLYAEDTSFSLFSNEVTQTKFLWHSAENFTDENMYYVYKISSERGLSELDSKVEKLLDKFSEKKSKKNILDEIESEVLQENDGHLVQRLNPDFSSALGVNIRLLDRINDSVHDLTILNDNTKIFKFLSITVFNCFNVPNDKERSAYSLLKINDERDASQVFHGWMLSAFPSISAIDHPRYDVWVASCVN